jgi:hypothetical protein
MCGSRKLSFFLSSERLQNVLRHFRLRRSRQFRESPEPPLPPATGRLDAVLYLLIWASRHQAKAREPSKQGAEWTEVGGRSEERAGWRSADGREEIRRRERWSF